MNIAGLSKAAVLAALYNAAGTHGNAVMHHQPDKNMTEEEAQQILSMGDADFDYLQGRVMKIDLSNDDVDTRLYNRDNGDRAAEEAVALLRS